MAVSKNGYGPFWPCMYIRETLRSVSSMSNIKQSLLPRRREEIKNSDGSKKHGLGQCW